MIIKKTQILDIGRALVALAAAVFFSFYAAGHLGAKAFGDASLMLSVITLYDGRRFRARFRSKPRHQGLAFWTMCLAIFVGIVVGAHALRSTSYPNLGIGLLIALTSGAAAIGFFVRASKGLDDR